MNLEEIAVIVLAAGRGTRMGMKSPKVLAKILGKPILRWGIETVLAVGLKKIVVVVGYGSRLVKKSLNDLSGISFADQKELLGTAHAVRVGLDEVDNRAKTILVLFGDDAALYRPRTLNNLLNRHISDGNLATILTTRLNKPTSLGGLRHDVMGRVVGIISRREMEEKEIKEHSVLCGAICFERPWLKGFLGKVAKAEIGEYLLPSFISELAKEKKYAIEYPLEDGREWTSINTRDDLKQARVIKSQPLT